MNTRQKIKIINSSGVTLLELVVSVGLFAIIIVLVSGIFQTVMASQYEAVASQEIQENLRYSMEKISKEIRMAQKDGVNFCTPSGSNIYWVNPGASALQFVNSSGKCVCYYIDNEKFMTSEGGCNDGSQSSRNPVAVFPQKIKTSNLVFIIVDSNDEKQAFVTFRLRAGIDVRGFGLKEVDVETNLSSRFYE